MTQKIIEEALSFMNFDKIPSMKELNKRYRQLALQMHPDKNNSTKEATEKYQNLLNCYRTIGEKILEESTETNEDTNDEEKDNFTIFKTFNFDQKNTLSHTISIERDRIPAWRTVLTARCGDPVDLTTNGLKYQVDNFVVHNETFTITVTLYETTSNLHIQSGKQFANDMFILNGPGPWTGPGA